MGSPFNFFYCLVVARRQPNQLPAKVALTLGGIQGAPVALLVLMVIPVLLGLV